MDLDIFPVNSPAHAHAQGLDESFLGREPGCEMGRRISLLQTVMNFIGGEDLPLESFPPPLKRFFNPLHHDEVDTGPVNHKTLSPLSAPRSQRILASKINQDFHRGARRDRRVFGPAKERKVRTGLRISHLAFVNIFLDLMHLRHLSAFKALSSFAALPRCVLCG